VYELYKQGRKVMNPDSKIVFETNRIDCPNGQYKARGFPADVYSDTEVIVKSNLVDIKTLIQAHKEIITKGECEWHIFIEDVEYIDGKIFIYTGS